jgi:hypothetical protein
MKMELDVGWAIIYFDKKNEIVVCPNIVTEVKVIDKNKDGSHLVLKAIPPRGKLWRPLEDGNKKRSTQKENQ